MVYHPEQEVTNIPWVIVSLSLLFLKTLQCYLDLSCKCTSHWSAWDLSGNLSLSSVLKIISMLFRTTAMYIHLMDDFKSS